MYPLAQRLHPGGERGALGTGLPLGRAQLADPGRGGAQRGRGLLVLPGQPGPVVVPARALILQVLVLALGQVGPGLGLVETVGQPPGLLVGGGRLTARRTDLGAQPGQLLGPLRFGPDGEGQPAFLLSQRGLRRAALRGHGGQLLARGLQPLAEHRLLLAQRFRFGVQLVRVPARARSVRLGHQVGVPLLGQAGHPAEAFGKGGEGEPGLLRGG